MATISIKQLLDAGVHFGHQTGRWNPKMKPFIFGERNGVHIIDLQKTLNFFKVAIEFTTTLAAQGKTVLFVGTKSQARETIEEEARRCGMYWITNRWLGGLLTNFATVKNSIKRYRDLETMRDNGFYEKLSKKEVARLERERKKLEKNLRGIRDIDRCPDALFIVDSGQESIAVQEAAKLNIPIIAVVDTNSDPDLIDYVIPGNDDALRSVKLFAETVADAILAGRSVYTARVEAEMQEAQEKAAKEEAQRKAAKEAKEAAKLAAEAQQAEQAKEPVDTGGEVEAKKPAIEKPAVPTEAVEAEPEGEAEKVPAVEVEGASKKTAAKKKAPVKKAKSGTAKTATTAKVKKSAAKSKKTASKTKKTTTKSKAAKATAAKKTSA